MTRVKPVATDILHPTQRNEGHGQPINQPGSNEIFSLIKGVKSGRIWGTKKPHRGL